MLFLKLSNIYTAQHLFWRYNVLEVIYQFRVDMLEIIFMPLNKSMYYVKL